MGRPPWTERQRVLIAVLSLGWKLRGDRPRECISKEELIRTRLKDLELEAQYRDVHRQLDEYDRSREPEVRGRWNRVCGECGYVNHERHRFCESCGCTLVDEIMEEVLHVCPKCNASVPKHSHECGDCGARFWSPIIVRASPEEGPEDLDGGR